MLTPVVENAISGDAMRPGDVLSSRAGISIEVGNTDADRPKLHFQIRKGSAAVDPMRYLPGL